MMQNMYGLYLNLYKDYEKEKPKQHNSRFCKLCKGTGWISWTARNNQLLRYTQCHQCQ